MKKLNWFTNIGIGLIAVALLLKGLNLQHGVVDFIQGFSLGLGLVLIVKGFITGFKRTSVNC